VFIYALLGFDDENGESLKESKEEKVLGISNPKGSLLPYLPNIGSIFHVYPLFFLY